MGLVCILGYKSKIKTGHDRGYIYEKRTYEVSLGKGEEWVKLNTYFLSGVAQMSSVRLGV